MNFFFKYKWAFVSISVIAMIAGGVSWWFELNLWIILFVLVGSILVTGIMAALEDDMPGGYSNPDGMDPSKRRTVIDWIIWGVFVFIVGLYAFVLVWDNFLV